MGYVIGLCKFHNRFTCKRCPTYAYKIKNNRIICTGCSAVQCAFCGRPTTNNRKYCYLHKCTYCSGISYQQKNNNNNNYVNICKKHDPEICVGGCGEVIDQSAEMIQISGYCDFYICNKCICSVKLCINNKYSDSEYCIDHYCRLCGQEKSVIYEYCSDCICSYSFCSNVIVKGSKYCSRHKCKFENCTEYMDTCSKHICKYNYCNNYVVVGVQGPLSCCSIHLCKRCLSAPVESNLYWSGTYCSSCLCCSCVFSRLHDENGGFKAYNPHVENRNKLYCEMCRCVKCKESRGVQCIPSLFSGYISEAIKVINNPENVSPEAEMLRLLFILNGNRWCERCMPCTYVPFSNNTNNNINNNNNNN